MNNFLDNFNKENYDGQSIVDEQKSNAIPNENSSLKQKGIKDLMFKYKYQIGGLVIIVLVFILYFMMSFIKVPDLTNEQISSAKEWAIKNDITLKLKEEYSLDYEENIVMKQDKKMGSKIRKKDTVTINVSKGANPEERIMVPNLKTMNIVAIEDWIAKNKLDNINLEGTYSKSLPKGSIISVIYDGDLVSQDNFKRKDTMTIKVSKGPITAKTRFVVPDFTNSDKYALRDWAIENGGININYIYQRHETKDRNAIISQNIKKGSKITRNQSIMVKVSLGKGSVVANFKGMSYSEAKTKSYAQVKMIYSTKHDYGKFIRQSIGSGTRIYGAKKVVVYYSAGRPYIGDLTGMTMPEVKEYIYKINQKGSNIKVKATQNKTKGHVVKSNKKNQYVKMNSTVWVTLK